MGKIVKYCANCEEGFAEKFSFCPNCASALTAYEMNPMNSSEVLKVADPVPYEEPLPVSEPFPADEPQAAVTENSQEKFESAPATQNFSMKDDEIDLLNDEDFISDEKPVSKFKTGEPETVILPPAATIKADAQNLNQPQNNPKVNFQAQDSPVKNSFVAPVKTFNYETDDREYHKPVVTNTLKAQDGLYHITFVEEKNASGRNMLMLGAFFVVTLLTFGGVIYSLFAQSPYIGSLNENDILVAYTDTEAVPEEVKPDMPEPKKKDDGGGGGGGGKNDPNPVSKGVLATQTEKPMIAPSADMVRLTKPELVIQASTQGNRQEKPTDQPYGNPNSKFDLASDGPGSGGGQGTGVGRGQGGGIGTGAGNGIGSGNGNGNGNGNGDGDGDGDGAPPKPPAAKPAPPVVQPFKIISKPRANYTDAARQNQVTGVVRVRVTFLPSGAIGSVTPLNSLPYGLTEQAISAAKQIRFEPQKSNGSPVAVTKVIEYSFSIF